MANFFIIFSFWQSKERVTIYAKLFIHIPHIMFIQVQQWLEKGLNHDLTNVTSKMGDIIHVSKQLYNM